MAAAEDKISALLSQDDSVAQLVECRSEDAGVIGSNPV